MQIKAKVQSTSQKMKSPVTSLTQKPVPEIDRNQKEWSARYVATQDALCSDVQEMVGRRNEGRSQYHVFYALVHGVTQEIDYLRKCEEETWIVPTDQPRGY